MPADLPPGTIFPAAEVAVLLKLQVEIDGKVSDAELVKGPGEPFDSAALKAARKLRFEPARLGPRGKAVPVSVSFRLRIRRPPPPAKAAPASQRSVPLSVSFGGLLLERGTRKPLVGVEVTAEVGGKTLATAVTDDDGRFGLKVAARAFTVRAISPGHDPLSARVVAKPGERREERIYLESRDDAFVTTVRSQRVRREVTKQVLAAEVVAKLPGTAGDTLKAIQILPGVARSGFDSGQLILRGASPGDSRIYLEGQEIPILYHFGGLRSTFNSVFLKSVEFIPGNFAVDYGRATGGVVNVKVRDPARDMFRGQVDINLYDASVAAEGPLSENWSVGGAFRRSYIDAILPAVLPDDAGLSFDTLPRFYDYQLLATWRPDAKRRLRFIVNGSLDKLELVFDRPQSDPTIRGGLDARIMFHTAMASYEHQLTSRLSQESSIQLGYQQFKTTLGPDLFFDLGVARLSLRSAWRAKLNELLSLRAGVDVRYEAVQISLNAPLRAVEGEDLPPISTQPSFGVERSADLISPGAFVEAELRPTRQLSLVLGARLDYYNDTGAATIDPRLVLRYQPRPGTVLKGGFGAFHQPPTADQTDKQLGNPDLRVPGSLHASLGLEQRLFDAVDLELTGFYKWLDQQVIRNPRFFYDPSTPPYVSAGKGRIFGLELLLRTQLADRVTGWLAYTFQRSFRTDGYFATERVFDFDQPHILTLVTNVRIGAGWSAGLRFRLISGSPSTPVEGSIYDAVSDTYVPLFGETNSQRLGTFHQLDLRVDKTFTFNRWKLVAFLDVQNVYNRRNPEGVSYSYDYAQSAPVSGLPILPILGLKGVW